MDHVALNKLALTQYRFCWSTLVASLVLFLCLLFLPVYGLRFLGAIVAIGFCPMFCAYRLAGILQFTSRMKALYVVGSASPLACLAAMAPNVYAGTGPYRNLSAAFPFLLDALAITFLTGAVFLVLLNLAAIRKLRDHGWNVSFLGTTLSRRL